MSLEQQFRQQSDLKASMAQLREMMNGDPSSLINGLMQSNPQFAKFYEENQGRTPQEAFAAYGYDFDEVMRIVNS